VHLIDTKKNVMVQYTVISYLYNKNTKPRNRCERKASRPSFSLLAKCFL